MASSLTPGPFDALVLTVSGALTLPIGMTNEDLVRVDGVDGVKAVVVRYRRTRRLCAVNTSAFLSCDGPRAQVRDDGSTRMGRTE